MRIWYEQILADTPKTKEGLSGSQGWVDVRDTALGHVLALEKEAAGGQRIITSGGTRHVKFDLISSRSYILIVQGLLIGKNGVCVFLPI